MVNRALQAKELKLKRQKRKLPKFYQHVYFTEGEHKDPRLEPKDDDVKDYKDSVRYRQRAKGLSEELAVTNFKGVTPARKRAVELIKQVVAEGRALCFTIIANSHQECRVFFNSQHTAYIIVHQNFKTGIVRRSIEYRSKERALLKWETQKIAWVV